MFNPGRGRSQGFGFYVGGGGYRGRRRDPYRDHHMIRIFLALAQQIMMMEHKPPVTLLIAAVNVVFFLKPEGVDDIVPSVRSGCLQPSSILYQGQWHRLLWAPFLHADEMHLYYNMASLLYKGSVLEPTLGSLTFLALIAELALSSGLLYVGLAALLAIRGRSDFLGIMNFLTRGGLMGSCAVGFSAVLFGLKVVLNNKSPGWSRIMGMNVPTKYAAWAELVLVQLIAPRSSFVGHVCGIVAGMVHVYVTGPALRRWQRERQRQRGGYPQNGGGGGSRTYGRGTWGS